MSGGGGDTGGSARAKFRAQDVFQCPELDVRMKKYLVRLANETANHLIRDTLEPNGDTVRFGNGVNSKDDDDDDDAIEGAVPDDDDGQVDARAAATNGLVWKKLSVVKGIQILRGHDVVLAADHAKDVAASCCLRGVTQVNASIEEFALLFKLDSNKQFAEHGLLFNPDLLDMATLYALVQPSGDHPRRYVGIKWCLVQSPSKLFRDRDFCYLECQKEFRDARGRRGWVRSLHSIKMPCCPSLEKSYGIVRASMYRCGLTAVESSKRGVLNVTYTVEMDLKGHFPELFQPSFIATRIATLASIDKFLQQQRLSSSPLLGDLDLPTGAAARVKTTCHLCYRAFSALRTRRVVCRKCGESVCKSCSAMWELDVPVIGKKKVRICTVCSADARYSHVVPRGFARACGGSGGGALVGAAAAVRSPSAQRMPPPRHEQRSLSFSAPSDFHHLRDYYNNNTEQDDGDSDGNSDGESVLRRHMGHMDHKGQRQQRALSHGTRRHGPSRASRVSYQQQQWQPQSYERVSRFDPVRATFEMRDPGDDEPLLDEYAAFGGMDANVRATTDLTSLWDPREDATTTAAAAAVPIDSPASYFAARLPQSFVTPDTPLDAPRHHQRHPRHEQTHHHHHQHPRQQRASQKIAPSRDSILFQQQQQQQQALELAFELPPQDSYSEHQRRQSDFSWDPRRRHTTNFGPSTCQKLPPVPVSSRQRPMGSERERQSAVARFGYHGARRQQQQQQQQQQQRFQEPQSRRRQQSYPFTGGECQPQQQQQQPSPSPSPSPATRTTEIYAQQRYRQQSDGDVHFVSAHGSRNFALEFFHEQYRNSSKPHILAMPSSPSSSSTSSSSHAPPAQQQQQRRVQRPQPSPFDRPAVPQPEAEVLETRHSQPSHEFHRFHLVPSPRHQQPLRGADLLPSPDQTAGEVVEYVETPEGEWVEQRLTVEAVRGNPRRRHRGDSSDDDDGDVDEEELLHPGFCIHCGAKRVRHFGAIESTCTCDLGGQRHLEQQFKSRAFEPSFEAVLHSSSSSGRPSGDIEEPNVALQFVTKQLAQQSLQSQPAKAFSTYST